MVKAQDEKIASILRRNVVEAIDRNSLEAKLRSGKQLRVKLGADPTAPDLHLGHAVILRELRRFQELGHRIVFIIGDFTAMIGDPSGRSSVKKSLTQNEVKKNAKTYFAQVGKLLDLKKTEIRYNSEWLGKLKNEDIIRLASKVTVSRILERDDFAKRLKKGAEVWLHELLYPLMQGYDSIAVRADIEVGGTDQLFNFMLARHLEEKMGVSPQDIITYEILPGLDGSEKMSKSLGNYIGITENPSSIFGKIMSLPDSAVLTYFRLATDRSSESIQEINERLAKENPRDIKLELAKEIVSTYHTSDLAERARAEFIRVFSKRELPGIMEEIKLSEGSYEASMLVLALGGAKSKTEAWRLVSQGAVEFIPSKGLARKLNDPRELIHVVSGSVVRIGKTKFVRIKQK